MSLGPFSASQLAALVALATTSYSTRRELVDAAVVGLAVQVEGEWVSASSFEDAAATDEGRLNAAVASLTAPATLTLAREYDLTGAAAPIDIPDGVRLLGINEAAAITGDAGTTALSLTGGPLTTRIESINFSNVGVAIDLDALPAGRNGAVEVVDCEFDTVGSVISWDTPDATAIVDRISLLNNQALNGTATQVDLQGRWDAAEILNNNITGAAASAINLGDDAMTAAIQRRGTRIVSNRIASLSAPAPDPVNAIQVDGVGVDIVDNVIEGVVGVTGPSRAIQARITFGTIAGNTIIGSGGGGWRAINLDGVPRNRTFTVTGTDDGDYTVILTSVDNDGSVSTETHTHPAVGQSATQIRDALEALIDGGALATAVDLGADGSTVVPNNRRALAVQVQNANNNLTLSSSRPTGYGVTVEGNVIQLQGTGSGIHVANEETAVRGNVILEPSGNAISVETTAVGNLDIDGNTILRTSQADNAIEVDAGDDINVTRNRIEGFNNAIAVSPSINATMARIRIEGNDIDGPGADGVDIDATEAGAAITDLYIRHNTIANAAIGVDIDGNVARATLGRSDVPGTTTRLRVVTPIPDLAREDGEAGTNSVDVDFALSAGWGSTATVTVVGGSTDLRGSVDVLCQGAGIAANPTITYTFRDGEFPTAPFVFVQRNDINAPSPVELTITSSVAQFVVTFNDLPVTATTYTFDYHLVAA